MGGEKFFIGISIILSYFFIFFIELFINIFFLK